MGVPPWARRRTARLVVARSAPCSRCSYTRLCTSVGVRRLLLASLAVGMRAMPRAMGGWILGRGAGAIGPGLGWPRSGLWSRQKSVTGRVSNSTETRDFLVSHVVVVMIMFALLGVYLPPDRFSTVEGIHELALGSLNRVCGDLCEP